ncbi:hypothetical protein [Streptomyces himalayensis]|uniref:Uncharacterized protein n=1 Tax=Streptomyces himalayensis subsp. himalayensis TaxID=2756131 RepID=A0A7W0DHH6_9ACTN|nr:hypothetical protein [Streptomyces himalayensis]MBA2944910.1 hypothetical protein [Streptomyces himalayensis subsp. himalayensis]
MKRACTGLLPYEELSSLVPDDVEGEVSQYGTVLEPDEESRSLVNCAVTWPGHGSVRVRAVPLVSPMPMTVKAEDIMPGGYTDGYEAPGLTGRVDEDGRPWIVAECAGGLDGQVREVSAMYVTADVDLPVPGKGKRAEYLADFRTAVQVANGITAKQDCGGTPLARPTRVIDTYEEYTVADPDSIDGETVRVDEPGLGMRKCRGLAERAGLPGSWAASGDLQDSRLLSVCTAMAVDPESPTEIDPVLEDGAVADVSAASWAGPLSRSAVDQYDTTGDVFDFSAERRTTNIPDGDHRVELALWARSTCTAGSTYHRVTVGMNIDFYDYDEQDDYERTLTEAERTRYSRNARKLMDSYLTHPGGWPRQQRCHDTEILGEVEGWR